VNRRQALDGEEEIALPQMKRPICTENKANLIRRYLFLIDRLKGVIVLCEARRSRPLSH
jgi:hypothetical protein